MVRVCLCVCVYICVYIYIYRVYIYTSIVVWKLMVIMWIMGNSNIEAFILL